MKKWTVMVLACGALQGAAWGGESRATEALAEELMSLMKVDEATQQALVMVRDSMMKQTQRMAAQSGQGNLEEMKAYQAKVMAAIEEELSWDKLKGQMVALYADTFTEQELKGLIEFYNGPVGKAFIAKQPQLMQKSMEFNQRMMVGLQPKIEQIAREFQAQNKAKAAAAAAAAAAVAPAAEPAR
jgi:hypothetical protein